ncbi:unnamed protein product [Cylindrotheca closterium]|uniref:Uncharacterized protein n=1 Tax=Cylindrotheca closterium TaxID=2856 RepID=A0AAD2FLQ4_9STRA|nr:unnamed protein product [Cylindrotheca closterium]
MKAVYRNNIIKRMGGDAGFDFLVSTYSENIHDDARLDRFFGNFDLNTLTCLQKELILVAFLEPNEETEPRKKRLVFRNDMMGMDRSIFPVLEEHFVDALEDCFIAGLDFELSKAYFSELRALFKECANVSKYRENIVERMGGEATFEFFLVSYCERLEEDHRLHHYFKDLDSKSMTRLQKELLLMAFLQPTSDNDFKTLTRRVSSKFSALFALGMNEEHFEMMESHFSASLYDCLSREDVIQSCLRLFANLMTFFQDNSLSVTNDVEEDEGSITGFDEESVTEFDEDEEYDMMSESGHSEADSVLSPMPPFPRERAPSYVTKRIQDALSQSERSTCSISIRSVETTRTISSFENRQTQGNTSYVSRRIQEALEKSDRSSGSNSVHSMPHEKNECASCLPKRIEYGSDRFFDPLKDSQRTEATVSSVASEDGKAGTRISPIVLSKRSKGKPKMMFSWKKPAFRSSNKKTAVHNKR